MEPKCASQAIGNYNDIDDINVIQMLYWAQMYRICCACVCSGRIRLMGIYLWAPWVWVSSILLWKIDATTKAKCIKSICSDPPNTMLINARIIDILSCIVIIGSGGGTFYNFIHTMCASVCGSGSGGGGGGGWGKLLGIAFERFSREKSFSTNKWSIFLK